MRYQNEWMGFRKEPLAAVETDIKNKKNAHLLRFISARKMRSSKVVAVVQKTGRRKAKAVLL